MGRVTIQQDQGAGKYLVQIEYDTRRVDLRISKLQAEIAKLEQADQGPIWKALNALLDAKAELDLVRNKLNQFLADIQNADPWASSTTYVLNTRVRINAFLLARCALAGISGSTLPQFPQSGTVRENFVRWNTFDSGAALGHPFWQRNTNYTQNDQIFTGYSPSPGLSRYATAQTSGRSGNSEPGWAVATVDDGGIIWEMEPKRETLAGLAQEAAEISGGVQKAQLEYDRLTSRLSQLKKELTTVQAWLPDTTPVTAWCQDYTEGLTGEVNSAEVNGESKPQTLNIRAATVPYQNVIDLHNAYRAANNLPALLPDYRLYDAAQRHVVDVATNRAFSHIGSDGKSFAERATDAGFDWQRIDLSELFSEKQVKQLSEWTANTEYNVGSRISLGTLPIESAGITFSVFIFATATTKGKSGAASPTFPQTDGATVKENFVAWTTFDSATDLGHPAWQPQTDYAVNDNVKTSFVLPAGQIRYAKATQTGRSGSTEPDFSSSPVDDGGILWKITLIYSRGAVAENVAWGYDNYDDAFTAWQGSPGHNANILSDKVSKIGIGYHTVYAADYPNFELNAFVVVFGAIDRKLGEYEPGSAGKLQPSVSGTAASVAYNIALLPGWQKWMPTYRIGTLVEIDRNNNKGRVLLDFSTSYWAEQLFTLNEVDIDSPGGNVPQTSTAVTEETRFFNDVENATFRYMNCDHMAFCRGDKVLVEYAGQNRDYPYIVGFPTNPKPCALRIRLIRGDGRPLRPDNDVFVDFTMYTPSVDENGDPVNLEIGSGGWSGSALDPPPITPGFRQAVSYDAANDYWIVGIYESEVDKRPIGPVWLEIDATEAIPSGTQYPYNYKTASKFQEENLILSFCDPLEMTVPYWRIVTNAEDRVFDNINDCHVTASATVYSSVPYQTTHTWLNTFPLQTLINATSTFVGAFVNSYPDGRLTVFGDGAVLAQSAIASPPTNFEDIPEGTDTLGPVNGVVSGRSHTTTLNHDNLTASFGGDPWDSSLTLKAEHELGVSGIFEYDTQVFVGFVYDY